MSTPQTPTHEFYRHRFNWKLIQLFEDDAVYRCLECGGHVHSEYGCVYCPRCDNHGQPYTQQDRDLDMARLFHSFSSIPGITVRRT
jgi:hypothetical protein